MNSQAFHIIEALGLRAPKSYNLNEAIESQRNKFYLRYCKDVGYQSHVINKEELIIQRAMLEKEISKGKLLRIEDAFDSIAGCAVYANLDGIYGEYVSGHIISLLRKGICRKRFLIDKCGEVKVREAFQGFEATQIKGGYFWRPCENVKDKLNEITCYLLENLISKEKDLLLEILITEDDIIICDAKHPGMDMSWQSMKDIFDINNVEIFLKKTHSKKVNVKEFKIDGFDIDLSVPAKNIIIGNGAILSHYVTRNYPMYNTIKFICR